MWFPLTCLWLASQPADGGLSVSQPAGIETQMRTSFAGLMALQPYLASPSQFADAKNQEAIAKHVEALSKVQHAFPKAMAQEEPGLAAISKLFARYLEDTQKRWDAGDREYARYRLRTVTGLCLGCHAQERAESDFVDVHQQVEALKLSPLEKADTLAATRQFDLAMQAYLEVLKETPKTEMDYLDFLRAARQTLSLTVRVKQDPQATSELLSTLSRRHDLPPFMVEYLNGWKSDVSQWLKDSFKPKKATVSQLISKAQALVQQSGGTKTLLPDERQEIPFLRASGYLHEALRKEPTAALRGEALYLLGVCYSELQDAALWDIDTLYLEACVRENPHSAVAQKCLRRLSDRIYLGYTGSRGTQLPAEEVERLAELRALAEEVEKKAK